MVVADEVKVAADDGRYGFARVRNEKRGMRWTVVRRAAIVYITCPYTPQYLEPGQPSRPSLLRRPLQLVGIKSRAIDARDRRDFPSGFVSPFRSSSQVPPRFA